MLRALSITQNRKHIRRREGRRIIQTEKRATGYYTLTKRDGLSFRPKHLSKYPYGERVK